jgi:hypothetical protein
MPNLAMENFWRARDLTLGINLAIKRWSSILPRTMVPRLRLNSKSSGIFRESVAIVISNAKYTKSAYELSKSTGVLLLSHKDIPQLEEILKTTKG